MAKLNVYLLEALTHLLAMALREGWPTTTPTTTGSQPPPPPAQPVPPLVQSLLPRVLPRLARFSIPPFSRILLDGVLSVQRGLSAALPGKQPSSHPHTHGLLLPFSTHTCPFSSPCSPLAAPPLNSHHASPLSPDLLSPSNRCATDDVSQSLSRAVFRGLCGVLSDPHLDPDLLLNYTNTKATQAYVKAAVDHLTDGLETQVRAGHGEKRRDDTGRRHTHAAREREAGCGLMSSSSFSLPPCLPAQIQRLKRPLVPSFLSSSELWVVVSVVCGLYRLADRSPRDYGFLNFPTVLALTMLIDQVRTTDDDGHGDDDAAADDDDDAVVEHLPSLLSP